MATKSVKLKTEIGETLKTTPKRNRKKTTENANIETKKSKRTPIGKKNWEVPANQSRIYNFFKSCSKISEERKNNQMPIESFFKTKRNRKQENDITAEQKLKVDNKITRTSKPALLSKQKKKANKLVSSENSTTNTSGEMEGIQRKRRKALNKEQNKTPAKMCKPVECIDLCSDDDNIEDEIERINGFKNEDKRNNFSESFGKHSGEEEKPIVIEIEKDIKDEATSKPPSSPTSTDNRQSSTRKPTTTARSKRTPRPCPPYKCVEGTNFAVDAFQYGHIEGVKFYFLTHFHADHYVGLTGKFDMPIYLSQITANLVRTFIPVQDKYLHIVPLDDPIVVDGVQITAIDANHCPGAVMFLFKLSCGRCILHTGDFRACSEMESHPVFWNNDIDTIYLDTTYLSDKYNFCTQSESIDGAETKVMEFQQKHMNKRILYVCGSYVIGKEKFWSALAEKFNLRIWAEGNRKKAIDAMKLENLKGRLCDNPQEANMHVISIGKVNYKSLCEYFQPPFSDKYDLILAIRPSGWEKNSRPQYRKEINIIGIEYSEHSSHNELKRFVTYLNPKTIISTVPVGKDPFVTCKVPQKWYNYKTLTPHSSFQPLISSYMELARQGTNDSTSKTDKSFVNVSPLKSATNATIETTIRDQFLGSPERIELCVEIVGTENCKPSSNVDHKTNKLQKVENFVKIPPPTTKRIATVLDFSGDADSDWLS